MTQQLCDISDLKHTLGITDTVDDVQLELAIDAATSMIQQYCGRQFTYDTIATARVFVADSAEVCRTDDFGTTSGLIVQVDTGLNGTFEQVWSTADYQLEPLNGKTDGEYWPYNTIRAIESLWFTRDYGRACVQVTARWGWATIPNAVKQACLIQAITIFKSPDAPFGATPFADTGILRLRSALHPTAAALVQPYRLEPVMVG
jgi:hypothetical protein